MNGKSILITGGARSGKSSYAEKLAKDLKGNILYIATSIPFDEEMKQRVKKHQESRPKEWDTYEGFKNLGSVIKSQAHQYDGILIDCVTIMVTNLLFDYIGDYDVDNLVKDKTDEIERSIEKDIKALLEAIKACDIPVILVTNELGSGIVPERKLGRIFRDIAGRMNQIIGANVDEVYLAVCGIPLKIK